MGVLFDCFLGILQCGNDMMWICPHNLWLFNGKNDDTLIWVKQ